MSRRMERRVSTRARGYSAPIISTGPTGVDARAPDHGPTAPLHYEAYLRDICGGMFSIAMRRGLSDSDIVVEG
ncbi:hypothetical protein CGCF415_v000874 [Colletotrichum fructicola]|nr:hypothetical protein CGCSCA5_v011414 [Colletotrichum siamense]KAF4875108.1 hypothetical protein CGCSCA1_v005767 [Colletotrichum siamense]KAF4896416.1 hypothetical protein CGCFRS4_v005487 [Colletotrichum fructicola]KAF4916153.1 hypothetical protein CGCF415_v000874 [Colletotrichum fructicola]KAF4935460.1 hypothetical protein CGCF245_v007572 [Colletotrichum fructicola]